MVKKSLTKAQVKAAADRAEGLAAPSDDAEVRGRPTEYNPSFVEQAERLCKLGLTDQELADFFEVSVRTLHRWKAKYEDFCHSLKVAKEVADNRVERSLYHRANGYTFEAEEIFQHQGEIIRAKVRKHVPPDATSMIFWLKNRRPDTWRDQHKVEHSGTITLEALVGASLSAPVKQIEAVAEEED